MALLFSTFAFTAVQVQAADDLAVIDQVGIMPERQAKYDFSKPYIDSKVVLITRDDNTTIKNFSDLKGQNPPKV